MTGHRPGGDSRDPRHDPTLLGAYLLGTLEPEEHAAVERHVTGCAECRNELEDLRDLPELLDRVDLDDLEGGPVAGDQLFARVTEAIDDELAERRRLRRRRARLALAGAAAVAAGGVAAGVALTGVHPPSGPESFSASTGRIHMTVTVAPTQRGTALAVDVDGLPQNEHCRLIAVAASGARQTAGSWTASYSGSAHVSGLATSIRPAQLSEVVLRLIHTGRQVVVHT